MNTVKDKLIEALMRFIIESELYETALGDVPEKSANVDALFESLSAVTTSAWETIDLVDDRSSLSGILTDITELLESGKSLSSHVARNVLLRHSNIDDMRPSCDRMKLFLIQGHVQELMARIKAASELDDCAVHFQTLEKLQRIVARMAFKEKIEINERLYRFVHDFDRIDDRSTRNLLYMRIRDGEFS